MRKIAIYAYVMEAASIRRFATNVYLFVTKLTLSKDSFCLCNPATQFSFFNEKEFTFKSVDRCFLDHIVPFRYETAICYEKSFCWAIIMNTKKLLRFELTKLQHRDDATASHLLTTMATKITYDLRLHLSAKCLLKDVVI